MRFVDFVRKQGALRFSGIIKFPDDYEPIRNGLTKLSLRMQKNYKKRKLANI